MIENKSNKLNLQTDLNFRLSFALKAGEFGLVRALLGSRSLGLACAANASRAEPRLEKRAKLELRSDSDSSRNCSLLCANLTHKKADKAKTILLCLSFNFTFQIPDR